MAKGIAVSRAEISPVSTISSLSLARTKKGRAVESPKYPSDLTS